MIRLALCLLLAASPAAAGQALIAVAANFAATARTIAKAYMAESGNAIDITTGSTGTLYAQIGAGAPFDAMLSADEATPAKLAAEGHGAPRPYAVGVLALWVPAAAADADPVAALGPVLHVAIANPDLAPYGKAAVAAIAGMGLSRALKAKIVKTENIGQTFALVKSGAAEAGFVAASALGPDAGGLRWTVPPSLYPPIPAKRDSSEARGGEQGRAGLSRLSCFAGGTSGHQGSGLRFAGMMRP